MDDRQDEISRLTADVEKLRAENHELRCENICLRSQALFFDMEADWLVMMLSHYTEDCPFKFSQVYEHKNINLDVRGCERGKSGYSCVAYKGGDCWREVSRNEVTEMIDVYKEINSQPQDAE